MIPEQQPSQPATFSSHTHDLTNPKRCVHSFVKKIMRLLLGAMANGDGEIAR
jgi:hypothetical protein